MKQKAVAMATAFTMLLAVGATGFGSEILHQHPAYASQRIQIEQTTTPALTHTDTPLLTAPQKEK